MLNRNCIGNPEEAARMKQSVIMRRAMKRAKAVPPPAPVETVSQIGTILARRIHSLTGALPCGECTAEVLRLNTMTPDQVMLERNEIAGRMVQRFEQVEGWWASIARQFPKWTLDRVVRFQIAQAVAEAK